MVKRVKAEVRSQPFTYAYKTSTSGDGIVFGRVKKQRSPTSGKRITEHCEEMRPFPAYTAKSWGLWTLRWLREKSPCMKVKSNG